MVGVIRVHHHPADVQHLLAVAEAEVAVSAGAVATVNLDHHQGETGLSSVWTGQGALVQAGAPNDRRVLLCQPGWPESAPHHLMIGLREAETAPLLGMRGVLMVLIMVGALGLGPEALGQGAGAGAGAEAPWMKLKEKAPGMEMLEVRLRRTDEIAVQALWLGMTGVEGMMMMTTIRFLPEAVNNL